MADNVDCVQHFIFDGCSVRGIHVRLGETWQTVRSRNDHPPAVQSLLGEALAAAAALMSTVKMDGTMTLQTNGDGPVSMLVAQASGARTLRGMVSISDEAPPDSFAGLLGSGHLAITIDPGSGGERYQGIVALDGDSLAEVIDGYFVNSEQLPTRLWLAADGAHAAALLLQQLPAHDPAAEPDDTVWQHLVTLAGTITNEELVSLPAAALLGRLFAEDPVRVFEPKSIRFYCRCSRQRVGDMLRVMPLDELLETASDEGGQITVSCDFCNKLYAFDPVDLETLHLDQSTTPVSDARH
jgi:molecular chaperone Hsp33